VSDDITPGERRELRSVVRGQYKVLRAEVKRREAELKAEIESELLDRYRAEDEAIADAQREAQSRIQDCARDLREIGDRLSAVFPDLTVEAGYIFGRLGLSASNSKRTLLHRALMAEIPNRVGDANLNLDRGENNLLRRLSEGALTGDAARSFLDAIPTVGELVPRARLTELERGVS
jgi:hypothetical protein